MSSQDKHPLSDYSLWLVPSGSEKQAAQDVIDDLIKLETESPSFEPHVTLLHPISTDKPLDNIVTTLRDIVQALPGQARPMQLELKPADKGTFYFQSVLAPVQPTEHLLALRQACEDAFEWKGKAYFPHLSLLYGDLIPDRRDELAQHVRETGKVPKSVAFGEIVIVDCTGTVRDWKTVACVPLQ